MKVEWRLEIAPRLAIVKKGELVLVRHRSGWYGLPGGKVETGRGELRDNLMDEGAFAGLARETKEELGVDLEPYRKNLKRLGLAEVTAVRETERVVTDYLVPIFVLALGAASEDEAVWRKMADDERVYLFKLGRGPGGERIYPDARNAIFALTHRECDLLGGFLTSEKLYFQTRPGPRLLFSGPEWVR